MNNLFSDLLDECVVVFLDDIMVFSQTIEEHVSHLQKVCQRLKDNKYFAKLKKCEFFKQETVFLGHTVTA